MLGLVFHDVESFFFSVAVEELVQRFRTERGGAGPLEEPILSSEQNEEPPMELTEMRRPSVCPDSGFDEESHNSTPHGSSLRIAGKGLSDEQLAGQGQIKEQLTGQRQDDEQSIGQGQNDEQLIGQEKKR